MPLVGDRVEQLTAETHQLSADIRSGTARGDNYGPAIAATLEEISDILLYRIARVEGGQDAIASSLEPIEARTNLLIDRLARVEGSQDAIASSLESIDSRARLAADLVAGLGSPTGALNDVFGLSALGPDTSHTQQVDLTPRQLAFLNWAVSHRGLGARAGLWMNEPVVIGYTPQGAAWTATNERIVELPFAYRCLSTLTTGSRVVDVGSAESTFSLSLASLGYEVTAVDTRGYPYSHPRLRVVSGSLLDFDEVESFDAATLISTIEHIGLPCYGNESLVERADIEAMRVVRKLLRPGGKLVLTTPFGAGKDDDFQRVYTKERLSELLQGFRVIHCDVATREGVLTWSVRSHSALSEVAESLEDRDLDSVAMVLAERIGSDA